MHAPKNKEFKEECLTLKMSVSQQEISGESSYLSLCYNLISKSFTKNTYTFFTRIKGYF